MAADIAQCAEPQCPATVETAHAWDNIRAHDAGWFFQKDGTSWCPEHHPAWVKYWRAERAKRAKK